jgi:hypothetical protein
MNELTSSVPGLLDQEIQTSSYIIVDNIRLWCAQEDSNSVLQRAIHDSLDVHDDVSIGEEVGTS